MGLASQVVQGNRGNLLDLVTKHKIGKLNKSKPETGDINCFETIYFILKKSEAKEKRELDKKGMTYLALF